MDDARNWLDIDSFYGSGQSHIGAPSTATEDSGRIAQFGCLQIFRLHAVLFCFFIGVSWCLHPAEAVGVPETFSLYLVSIRGAFSGIGRLVTGYIVDMLGPVNVSVPMTVSMVLLTFLWPLARTQSSLIAIAALYGFTSGTYIATFQMPAYTLGDIEDVGRRAGMMMTFAAFGAIAGPPISGAIYQASGSFAGVGYYAALAATTVIVHPLVLLSVADHHARSISRGSHKRVIGVLLGQDNGKTINVANSFGIPFEEDEKDSKTWFLDHNYIEGMYEMFKKVNARERMIGWYHTGPKLRASDQEINELFKRFVARPVMVIVDVRPQTVGIPTDAYFAVEEIKDDGTETRKTFLHVPSAIEAEEAEEIGVEHLLRDIKDSTTTTLATRVAEQLASLRGLQSRLSDVQKYLVDVAAGTMPVNHQIVYHLQDALNLLPDLADPAATQSFAASTNDQMLVVYLSSLLRAVIALHGLVDNKSTIGRAEVEEAKEKEKEKRKTSEKKEKETSKNEGEQKGL
ncbi:hypothetical protein H0H87_007853 [Tephrocybe sp. NHM501043]|nr:hypothetical protein H0H87_007853 [Tephrocybe sp. NHM501043]